VIFDRETLEQFAFAISVFARRGAPPVQVDLPMLANRAAVERSLNRGLRARGVLESGVAGLIGLCAVAVLHLAGRPLGWRPLAADVGIVLAAAVCGKLLGMARGALMRMHAVWVMRRALPLHTGYGGVAPHRPAAKAA
jgi:hypothetical protein